MTVNREMAGVTPEVHVLFDCRCLGGIIIIIIIIVIIIIPI